LKNEENKEKLLRLKYLQKLANLVKKNKQISIAQKCINVADN